MGLYGYDDETDYTKLRYVLYARKSTEDETRQVKSIEDQINECRGLATRLGLTIVEILQESKSAKRPNNRQIFSQMLRDLNDGKYDGIIAWHPDRLARNMLEGGQLIDMIDEGIIKDLKFVTHHFTKDANGKMLLGMAFVLSKQYSDKLSQDVTRGVRSHLAEGKSPVPKFGYIRDETGVYRPDGRNHELICEAWKMRVKGISIENISDYLNKEGFYREIKSSGKKTRMTMQKLSKAFADCFYYGMLIQADHEVDLRTIYDFVPATTEDDFFTVKGMSYRRIKPSKPHRSAFYPFRLMVQCSYCHESMRVAPSTSATKGNRYLYFRCDTKGCPRKKKSIRGKVLLDFIYDFLKEGLNFTEKEYKEYLAGMKFLTDDKKIKLREQANVERGMLKRKEREVREISINLAKIDPQNKGYKIMLDKNTSYLEELNGEIEGHKAEIQKIENKLKESEGDVMSYEQFANLSKNAVSIVQSADAVGKDLICREIFANFSVDESKVASYRLKEPFATLIEKRKFLFSRGGETRTHDPCVPNAVL